MTKTNANSIMNEGRRRMKKILLLHGYNGIPQIFHWIKEELEKMQYVVIMPNLPPREGLRYSIWKEEMGKLGNQLQGELIVVAHSAGNPFIIKYLQEHNLDIELYIGLAGFSNIYKVEGREDLYEAVKSVAPTQEELENFKQKVEKRYCIYSDNDHIVPFEILQKHVENIAGIGQMIPNIGHMGRKSNLQKIPEVIAIIRESEKIKC